MKKYQVPVSLIAGILSISRSLISFWTDTKNDVMQFHISDFLLILQFVAVFCFVYYVLSKNQEHKRKILMIKKYNEERFDITIKSIKTHLQENNKEHDIIAKVIAKNNSEFKIEEGREERVKELWDKIMKDFQKVQSEYDDEFKNWKKS
jgi:hypothetical protein